MSLLDGSGVFRIATGYPARGLDAAIAANDRETPESYGTTSGARHGEHNKGPREGGLRTAIAVLRQPRAGEWLHRWPLSVRSSSVALGLPIALQDWKKSPSRTP